MSDNPTHDDNGRFAKGNPGGPGRPRSAIGRGAIVLDDLGAGVGEEIFQVLVDKAKAGDLRAVDMLLSRVWPTRRGRPLAIDTVPMTAPSDLVPVASDVTNAVLRGELTPHEGRAVSSLFQMQCRLFELEEFERRLQEVEKSQAEFEAEQAARRKRPFASYSADRTTVFDDGKG
jgi:hypothetical protein